MHSRNQKGVQEGRQEDLDTANGGDERGGTIEAFLTNHIDASTQSSIVTWN